MYPPARASSLPLSAYPLRRLPFTKSLLAIVAPLLTGLLSALPLRLSAHCQRTSARRSGHSVRPIAVSMGSWCSGTCLTLSPLGCADC